MTEEGKQYESGIEVMPPEYQQGKPASKDDGRWAKKLQARSDILKYLYTGEGYKSDVANTPV